MSIDNPPAFPEVPADCNAYEGREGMTLRDHFAGQAIVGIEADGVAYDPATVARDAYALADAMLAERIVNRS